MSNNKNVASGSAGAITLMRNDETGVKLFSSHANSFDLSISTSIDEAMSGGNSAVKFLSDGKAELSISFDIFSMPLLSVMFGLTETTGVTSIFANDLFKSPTTTITLSDTPEAGTIYVTKLEDGDNEAHLVDGEITDGDATNVGEYSIAANVITLNVADLTNNIRVYYKKESSATTTRYDFKAKDVKTIGYTISFVTELTEAKSGNVIPVHLEMKNFQPDVNTSLTFNAGTHATIDFSGSAYPDVDDINFSLIQI